MKVTSNQLVKVQKILAFIFAGSLFLAGYCFSFIYLSIFLAVVMLVMIYPTIYLREIEDFSKLSERQKQRKKQILKRLGYPDEE